MLYVNFLLCCFAEKLLYLAKIDLDGSVFLKTLSLCPSRLWWHQVILPRQNRLGQLHISPWKSSLYGCLDCGDTTWYHLVSPWPWWTKRQDFHGELWNHPIPFCWVVVISQPRQTWRWIFYWEVRSHPSLFWWGSFAVFGTTYV